MIITIDGHAGTGKSTVAKLVAERLGYTYFDTGAMYRSLTYLLIQKEIAPDDVEAIENTLENFPFRIRQIDGEKRYLVGDQDLTQAIRTPAVNALVSEVAALPTVRSKLVSIQRAFGKETDAVFEGRDLGTVVFPKANLKIFLTADPKTRSKRRYQEMLEKDPSIGERFTVEEIQKQLEERDHNDSTRKVSPLKQAEDAILIDTSSLSIKEVVEEILSSIKHVL